MLHETWDRGPYASSDLLVYAQSQRRNLAEKMPPTVSDKSLDVGSHY